MTLSIATLATLFAMYAYLMGTIYLYAYWSTFGVVFTDFISVEDIAISMIKPTIYSLTASSLAIISELLPNTGLFPSGGGRSTNLGKVVNKSYIKLFICLALLLLAGLVYFYGKHHKFVVMGTLIYLFLLIRLYDCDFFASHRYVKQLSFLLFFIIFSLFYTYQTRLDESILIKDGIGCRYMKSCFLPMDNKCRSIIVEDKVKFLGFLGKFVIFQAKNTLLICDRSKILTTMLEPPSGS